MNVSIYLQTDYENIANWTLGENKPNSKPIKANFKKNECKLLCYRVTLLRRCPMILVSWN